MLPCLLVMAANLAPADAVERRVQDSVSKLSLDEKIALVGGVDDFYTKPVPRLGIRRYKMSDGPVGVRNYGPATAMPAPLLLAATFNPKLAKLYGTTLGREARAREVDILLGPGMNIYRVPVNGRNFEYLGEDPFLAARIAPEIIQGIQNLGVVACAKHYAANNQEYLRTTMSSEVDETTLREIYFPAFEASVKQGKVGSIMASYNLVNGVHASQNHWLLQQVLKDEWGFDGFVVSDWWATHEDDPVQIVKSGLDLEMPFAIKMTSEALHRAIDAGQIQETRLSEMVANILRPLVRLGAFDRKPEPNPTPEFDAKNDAAALEVARQGLVLLKNDRGILPLDPKKVRNIAVIGPNADPTPTGGGGSSYTHPTRSISILSGVRAIFGQSKTTYSAGVRSVPKEAFAQSKFETKAGKPGLDLEFFANRDLSGDVAFRTTTPNVNFAWDAAPYEGGSAKDFSARLEGFLIPEKSASYDLVAGVDDGVRVWVDDEKVIDAWNDQGETVYVADRQLVAGKKYKIRIEYYQGPVTAVLRFGYHTPDADPFAAAIETARKADVAVVCVGFNQQTEAEGFDRAYELRADQVRLIQAVTRANPRTIVVLNSGGSVETESWIRRTPALIHAFYAGQEGGRAIAELLAGVAPPSGRLPFSWEKRREDWAAAGAYPGENGKVVYKEGLLVGYRHFDAKGIAPLFPFGFGLSTTRFAYSDLSLRKTAEDRAEIRFKVRNVGDRRGVEVPQVYVGLDASQLNRPPRELKGFERLDLKPGESRTVSIPLDRRAFSYWSEASKAWELQKGSWRIWVGSSSRDWKLEGSIRL